MYPPLRNIVYLIFDKVVCFLFFVNEDAPPFLSESQPIRLLNFLSLFVRFLNLSWGGLARDPSSQEIEFVGHVVMHVAHAKQSGIMRSRLRMAPITVEGQALAHASQAMHVS
jgi:hypothetical protein